MRAQRLSALACSIALAAPLALGSCSAPATGAGTAADGSGASASASAAAASASASPSAAGGSSATATASPLADGEYEIAVDTDSSMFRSEHCTLVVEGGAYTARLTLPGEGFSRLYFGTAAEAASASDADIYDYALDDEGKYTFTIPVPALDQDLAVAAYGQRRDSWYDHTITFHAPAQASA